MTKQPEVRLSQGYQVESTIVTPVPVERAYHLRQADFLTLCHGTNGNERAGRDLHLGLAVSALVGLVSLSVNVDWPEVLKQEKWWALVTFLVLSSITVACGCVSVHCWNRMRQEITPYTRLKESISEFFQGQGSVRPD